MKQNKHNDDDLKALFDQKLEIPESLSTDAVKETLRQSNVKQFKKKCFRALKVKKTCRRISVIFIKTKPACAARVSSSQIRSKRLRTTTIPAMWRKKWPVCLRRRMTR